MTPGTLRFHEESACDTILWLSSSRRAVPGLDRCLSVHRRGELIYQLRHNVFCAGIVDLTRSRRHMSAAAVPETERADVNLRASVDDRLAYGKNGVLLFDAPEYMHGDTALRKQSVDHESVARIDDLLVAKIEDDKILVNTGTAQDLLTKLRLVLAV